MRYLFLFFIMIFFLYGCGNENTDSYLLTTLLYDVDSLSVHHFSAANDSGIGTTDASQIKLITDLLAKEPDMDTASCKASGKIYFYKKGTSIYEVFFSTGKQTGAGCEQLIYNIDGKKHSVRLTYQAGMFISNMR